MIPRTFALNKSDEITTNFLVCKLHLAILYFFSLLSYSSNVKAKEIITLPLYFDESFSQSLNRLNMK